MHVRMYKCIAIVLDVCRVRALAAPAGLGRGALPGAAALSHARSPTQRFRDGRGFPRIQHPPSHFPDGSACKQSS